MIGNIFANNFEINYPDKICAILVEFQTDENNATSGDGKFLTESVDVNLDGRSEDFIIDPPPHNEDYFRSQLKALANYYSVASNGNIEIDAENSWISPVYILSKTMQEYNPVFETDNTTPFHLQLVEEAINFASADMTLGDFIVIFHAGVGQDFAIPLDPTPFDLPSSYFNETDLANLNIPASVENVILLPETQNHAFFPEEDSYYDFQVGLTGTFALLFGYYLGLPTMFDTETGRSGIGYWGLMDQGSNNLHGVCPALPNPWTRRLMNDIEWSNFSFSDSITTVAINEICKIPINSSEYFLAENRSNMPVELDNYEMRKIGTDSLFVIRENGVITQVSNYDSGIPGSGILIWHVDEQIIAENWETNTINANPDHRGIDLEEADGSQDLGENYGFFFPGGTENGWQWDAWYAGNPAYFHLNPDVEPTADSLLVFDATTHPNTNTNFGGNSHLKITILDKVQSEMRVKIENDWLFDIIETDSITEIWQSPELDSTEICVNIPSEPFSPMQNDTIYHSISSFADLDNDGDLEKIVVGDEKLWIFNENGTLFPNFPIALLDNDITAASIADFDFDGICEIFVGTKNGLIFAYNLSGNVINGFPLSVGGEMCTQPAIGICDERLTIVGAANSGKVYVWKPYSLAEMPDNVRIPWGQFGANAIRDFQAEEPTGTKEIVGKLIPDAKKVFCYPNPAKENTTIRYFVEDADRVEIEIFTLSGRKIATFENTNITPFEFNETVWNLAGIESDVYFAKITAESGSQTETVIIKIGIAK